MHIINARQNNLKSITLEIPEDQLIVITGLSGSGKSSLAMDVIANEGYRYFLESVSSYIQQNAQIIPAAGVDEIRNLPPVVRVEQSKRFRSVNATFGTLSDLSAIFRILFARYATSQKLSKSLFSFNHPRGACECCRGIGKEEYIDLEKLVTGPNKTLREGAIATTLPNGYIVYSQVTVDELNKVCKAHGFSVDVPWNNLSRDQKDVILNGSDRIKVFYGKHSIESRLKWKGLKAKPREEGYYRGMLPIMNDILKRDRNPNILKFVSSRQCRECKGGRIKAEHLRFKWKGFNFHHWMVMPIDDLYNSLTNLDLDAGELLLVDKICIQLFDIIQLGMGEYRLGTPSHEISAGDAQRLRIIRQLNSNLQGILYVFDEPSIGLSKVYQDYLVHIFKRLIAQGNTVMVVEHDLNFIRSADWIIELGPAAGVHGGKVVFNGPLKEFLNAKNIKSPTLSELKKEPISAGKINTGSLDAFQPTPSGLTVISRKTPRAMEVVSEYCSRNGLKTVTVTDQPIGKTPRSNPATYTGLADKIRDLFAATSEARSAELAKGAFSFNNKTGRCDTCEGAGVITLSMNVMGSVNQICPKCNGKRFKEEVLKVTWKQKNIADIYDLSVEEALDFFSGEKRIIDILSLMLRLGLGYLKLGQPSNTLSGGEAQRVKLTKHFAKRSEDTLLMLEEPSIGLHQQNVRALLDALHLFMKQTAGILCFENHDLFRGSCDYWVDNTTLREKFEWPEHPIEQRDKIVVTGAQTHHLKNVDIAFPKKQLSVVTGISGSGKSSLVIDTLHGYGMQEMTKQFSSYQQSRTGVNFQFDVGDIQGLTPTICVTREEGNYSGRTDVAQQIGIDRILRFAFSRKAQYVGRELSASHFSNNHELGKCPVCDGLREELLPDTDRIVVNPEKSISEGLFDHNKALAYYGHPGSQYMAIVQELGKDYGFDLETPFQDLTTVQKEILFYGTGERVWTTTWEFKTKTRKGSQEVQMTWEGLSNYLKEEYVKTRKNKNIDQLKALLSPARCHHCTGSGLQPDRLKYKIGGRSIHDIKVMDFKGLKDWLSSEFQEEADDKLISRIKPHLAETVERAEQLHIDHLQLNRKLLTLSGGENQRVKLIRQLNSPLKGITYLLDEPSAGLSGKNIPDLIKILSRLRDKGNTVIVIEHHKEIIRTADHLVEVGPQAGKQGSQIMFSGTPKDYFQRAECHPYLKAPSKPITLEPGKESISISELSRFNLKKQKLQVPIGGITAVYGRSGVGKTTLVKDLIIPSVRKDRPVNCKSIVFPKAYKGAHYFERNKLRSYTTTLLVDYLGLLKDISKPFAKASQLKPRDFSYKTKTSHCLTCNGSGLTETSLDIAANVIETCETCNGKRYQPHILEVEVAGKNIAEVLGMTITELEGWLAEKKSAQKGLQLLQKLIAIGLGHLTLDQRVQSLSGGEKQRLLLLNWLEEGAQDVLYVIDEPSVGLHYADIDLLFELLKELSKQNDVLVIDHNPYLLEKIGVGIELT
ncbi:excinuclease ABC subunit A [Robertkochia marina]|uniref:UvrABC system protein A n=1 Tax=Robertkochia marina TaxID=1227945 RepID=A0A4S3LYV3_9FLAO|nr:excinuclease ABC subunit A [Robertkochia marina]THD66808.1 excinuclease ABC subunit A [Robertkochia marina]TRZ41901.1 excinuclease ABC subunit A [Robertkochia marina]